MPTQPNVLVVTTHDSGQHFGCYGVPTVRTPAIDGLAADGVCFDNMFAACPICSPSRGALLTGRYPLANGLVGLAGGQWNWELNDTRQHLSHVLREAGYHTALFGYQHETRFIERMGFDDLSGYGVRDDDGTQVSAPEVAERAAEFLRQRPSDAAPFYAQVGFFETHTDYGFGGAEPDDALGVWCPPYARCHGSHAWAKKMARFRDEPDFARAHLAALQGALRQADRGVETILNALDVAGLAEDTLVLFNTDHGVELPGAKWTLFDPGLRVAFIMRWPGGGVAGGGRCPWMLSNVDFLPTLCELAALDPPENLQGVSFAGALRDDAPAASPREVAFGQYVDSLLFCARTDRYKLIRNLQPADTHGRTNRPHELYDLALDPIELSDVSGEPAYADALDALRGHLDAWLRDMDDPSLDEPIIGDSESERAAHYRTLYETRH